ncbi:MAG: hypothetical protein ACFBSE_06595 [Prochloraceae cyanobacterium]
MINSLSEAKDSALRNVGGGIVREISNSGQALFKETVCKARQAGINLNTGDIVPEANQNLSQCTGDLERI